MASSDEAKAAFVARVRTHAQANYEVGGWDYVVEAWDDADILEALEGAAGDVEKAFAGIVDTLEILADRRADVQAEIW